MMALDIHEKNTEIVPGEHLCRGVKHNRVAKYSDFGRLYLGNVAR